MNMMILTAALTTLVAALKARPLPVAATVRRRDLHRGHYPDCF